MKYLFVVLLLMTFGRDAHGTSWKMDRSHSEVKFSVAHLVIAEVSGRFTDFDVTMESSSEDLTGATIAATVKAASINTDNEKRDGHLKADAFLNAERFPEITFRSTSVEKTGSDTYAIKGDLTIRDVTRPVVLETKYKGTIKDPWGNTKVAFKATTSVNRFDFGVKWDKATESGGLVAGENVDITLLLEFSKQ